MPCDHSLVYHFVEYAGVLLNWFIGWLNGVWAKQWEDCDNAWPWHRRGTTLEEEDGWERGAFGKHGIVLERERRNHELNSKLVFPSFCRELLSWVR